jgi:hypothetical protein
MMLDQEGEIQAKKQPVENFWYFAVSSGGQNAPVWAGKGFLMGVAAITGNDRLSHLQHFAHIPNVVADSRLHSRSAAGAIRERVRSCTRCTKGPRLPSGLPAVLVLEFSESPLDTNAIRKLVAAGNAHLLAKLRLPLPGMTTRPTIH